MEVTTKQLDEAVQKVVAARADYDVKKEISNEASRKVDQAEIELIDLLTQADKSNYQLDGVAKVTKVTKLQVNTPKDLEKKAALFKWIKEKFGAEGFLAYCSVNHQTLNSLYKQEFEAAEDKFSFSIDGVDAPVAVETIRVNKL